jgi:hypothetical protein
MEITKTIITVSNPRTWNCSRVLCAGSTWLFPDGIYYSDGFTNRIAARCINPLIRLLPQHFHAAVCDVTAELSEVIRRRTTSHIVIYGTYRVPVITRMILSGSIPGNIRLVLSAQALTGNALMIARPRMYQIDTDGYPFTDRMITRERPFSICDTTQRADTTDDGIDRSSTPSLHAVSEKHRQAAS